MSEPDDLIERARAANQAARIHCDEVLIELGLGSDATVIVRKPGSNVIPLRRRRS
jgi:hypothetical protein